MRSRTIVTMVIVSIIFSMTCFSSVANADPLDNWHWLSPYPTADNFNAILYEGGRFIAVGDGGMIMASPDGVNWSSRKSGTSSNLHEVIFGGGAYIALGDNGTLFTSPDGDVWAQSPFSFAGPGNPAYGNGRYVVLTSGPPNVAYTSTDGVNWTATTTGTQYTINTMIFAAGLFVAAGNQGAILTSTDGMNWAPGNIQTPLNFNIASVTYGNGIFVAQGSNGQIAFSTDGLNWSLKSVEISTVDFYAAAYGSNTFVMFGKKYDLQRINVLVSPVIMTSSDGINWSKVPGNLYNIFSSGDWISALQFGGGVFVGVGQSGKVIVSSDGTTWTDARLTTAGTFRAGAYGNGMYVAAGEDGLSGKIVFSADGRHWTASQLAQVLSLKAAIYEGGIFIAVGTNGVILTSPDGMNWTAGNSGTSDTLSGITFAQGKFVAVGAHGTVVTSADGVTWSATTTAVGDYDLSGITFGNGIFVAAASQGFTFVSSDGVSWGGALLPGWCASCVLSGIAYGNGTFSVVSSQGGSLYMSHDGVQWFYIGAFAAGLQDITFARGNFVSVSSEGMIVSSSDGLQWINRGSFGKYGLNGVFFGNNTFVAVGNNGSILQSDPVSSKCAATVSSDLNNVHLPIVNYNGIYLWGDMVRETTADGSLLYRVTNYATADPAGFTDCSPAVLSADFTTLQVPEAVYNNALYRADLVIVPSADNAIRVRVVQYALY